MIEDYIFHANTTAFSKRIGEAYQNIKQHLTICDRFGVSLSTGKDSTLMLDLIVRANKEAKKHLEFNFFDSGMEYPETYDMIETIEKKYNININIIEPELNMKELLTYANENKYFPGMFKEYLIDKPSMFCAENFKLQMFFIGLRKEESKGRMFGLSKVKDGYYFSNKYNYYISYPIMDLTVKDVYAYCVKFQVPIHAIYTNDKISLDIEKRRVGGYGGDTGYNFGRYAYLQQTHPELYDELCKVDPHAKYLG